MSSPLLVQSLVAARQTRVDTGILNVGFGTAPALSLQASASPRVIQQDLRTALPLRPRPAAPYRPPPAPYLPYNTTKSNKHKTKLAPLKNKEQIKETNKLRT